MRAAAFALLCLIWGLTWLATREGIAVVPPILFGGTRQVVAGALLLLICRARGVTVGIAAADRKRGLRRWRC